jgi:hypothetical protein
MVDPDALAHVCIALFHGFVLQKLRDPKVQLEPYLQRSTRFSPASWSTSRNGEPMPLDDIPGLRDGLIDGV